MLSTRITSGYFSSKVLYNPVVGFSSMVQVTFDTNNDSLEELKEALSMLQQAIDRRSGAHAPVHTAAPKPAKMDIAHPEETVIDTPFFKITSKNDDAPAPTLNELLTDESLTDDDFSKMLKEQIADEHKSKKEKPKEESSGEYIEIVEYTDEKQS